MARRKRFLDDQSNSSNASDEEELDGGSYTEVRELFEISHNPRLKRKRTKEDEIYGVFNDEDENDASRGSKSTKRFHYTQAPSFVTGGERTTDLDKTLEEERSNEEFEEDQRGDSDSGSDDAHADATAGENEDAATVQAEAEYDGSRSFGELSAAAQTFAAGGSGEIASKGGIEGFGFKSGIGPGFNAASAIETTIKEPITSKPFEEHVSAPVAKGGISSGRPSLGGTLPTKFETTKRRAFMRDDRPIDSERASTPLSLEERLHFSKISGTFGAKILAKMGWQAGTGLGASGAGIVAPVETKMRPRPSMGLAYKGFKEKTEQSKAEARRRGEKVSDDEGEVVQKRKRGRGPRSDVWKKPKKTKIKVEHQTYEQILQSAGQEVQAAGIGKIYDATSGEMREVFSLAGIAPWSPLTDTMRIPEIRHNLRLIVDAAKAELDGLAREARTMQERKRWIEKEGIRVRRVIEQEAGLNEIQAASQLREGYEVSLESFSPYINKLVNEYKEEYEIYQLDEVVVAAVAPVLRRQFASWQPLKESRLLVDLFGRWRGAWKFHNSNQATVDEEFNEVPEKKHSIKELVMMPYESLMWNVWFPRVRSNINNEWCSLDPNPVIRLYEAWSALLPPFIRDNLFDQLVIPKLLKGISDWNQRADGLSLQAIVFPWLPHLGLRAEELTNEAKRKVKLMLRNWKVMDEVPKYLISWKEILGSEDWTSMLLKYVIPKLAAMLREDFKVNPRKQEMKPLQVVLDWRSMLNPSIISQLLETEFFPKWLDVLHIWLIQPTVNFGEVADWYTFWKETFPADVRATKSVAEGFTKGLQLMDKARKLGPDARYKLAKPEHRGSPSTSRPGPSAPSHSTLRRPAPSRVTEITFRTIVEEFAASHDLLFMPTGRAHEKSRMPVFRVSSSMDGKGGVLVYILDDAVWSVEGEDARAITLDEMVLRASRGR